MLVMAVNAGFETVGMADTVLGARNELELPELGAATAVHIRAALPPSRLESLVSVRNPLDLNPMADE